MMNIPYQHCDNQQAAYLKVKENITAEKIEQFKVSAKLSYNDELKIIEAKGTGFDLSMEFYEHECEIKLKLSFLLKPLKNKVLSILERELKQVV